MTIEEIKQELIEQGKDPNDFNIKIIENGYTITPKRFYETKQVARKEGKLMKEDVDVVAETLVLAMMDIEDLAGMLVYALNKIDELEAKLNG